MINRVAYLSMHTSPLIQPGTGDAGGMNVYIHELATTMASRGIEVDVFTRSDSPDSPPVVDVGPNYRVHHIDAGPMEAISVQVMARWVRDFAAGVMARFDEIGTKPDVIHSNYWLSGWAGLLIKRELGIPHAISFHTLGRIKELTRRDDDRPESLLRIAAEHEVIEEADCVVAATPFEAEDLLDHYGADPARLCTTPPGVDHELFHPGPRAEARATVGWPADGRTVLFVGRIQPLKGVDVAVEAFGLIADQFADVRLVLIGGPSGPTGPDEFAAVSDLISRRGLTERVTRLAPIPHKMLPDFYRASDVLLAPSRSESFGLVAAEAEACGLPVVAAAVGGLSHIVAHEVSGLLVMGWEPIDYAEALSRLLTDHDLLQRLSTGAVSHAERFSWDSTAYRFLELYDGAMARAAAR